MSSAIFVRSAEIGLHLALVKLPAELLRGYWPTVDFDESTVTALRSCLMKPEHLDWLGEIRTKLKAAGTER